MSEIFKSPQHVINEPKRQDEGEKGKISGAAEPEWSEWGIVRSSDEWQTSRTYSDLFPRDCSSAALEDVNAHDILGLMRHRAYVDDAPTKEAVFEEHWEGTMDEAEKGKIRGVVGLEWRERRLRFRDGLVVGDVWQRADKAWGAQAIAAIAEIYPTEEAAKAAVEEAVRKALGGEDV